MPALETQTPDAWVAGTCQKHCKLMRPLPAPCMRLSHRRPQNASWRRVIGLVTLQSLSRADSASPCATARWENIASFSSIGPTTDGRIKPDIIAPGTTLSAKSAG